MVKCKRFVLSFIFSLLCIFCINFLFLSKSTNAQKLVTNVQGTGTDWVRPHITCKPTTTWLPANNGAYWCNNVPSDFNGLFHAIKLQNKINVKKDHYYEVEVALRRSNYVGVQNPYIWEIGNYDDQNLTLVDFDIIYEFSIGKNSYQYTIPNSGLVQGKLEPTDTAFSYVFKFTFKAKSDTQSDFRLGSEEGYFIAIENVGAIPLNKFGVLGINRIVELKDTDYDFNQEKQDNELQGTDGQNNSNQSGQQVEGQTQNLLQTLGGFISAFTSASATNCNFDMGEFLGVQDFCSISIPSVYSAILNIVSILVVIPMVYWLFGSITNAFKEFQQ